MVKIEKSITIKAPIEKVFDYWQDPSNLPEIWPSIVEIRNIIPLPNGGYKFWYIYKMAGMRFKGSAEDIEYMLNQRVINKSKGGIRATQIFTYQSEAGGTKMTWEIEYSVPVPLLGKLAEAIIVKMNEREAELVLANFKARMEV